MSAIAPAVSVADSGASVAPAASPSASSAAPRVRTAVIVLSACSRRLFPGSRACPSSLLPLVDVDGVCKPVLHIVVEEVLRAFEWREEDAAAAEADGSGPRIAIVVQSDRQRLAVQQYFSQDDETDAHDDDKQMQTTTKRIAAIGKLLHLIVQEDKTLGIGGAVLVCRSWAGSSPFLLLQGDAVFLSSHPDRDTNCARQLLDLYACVSGRPECVGPGGAVMCTALADADEDELVASCEGGSTGLALVQGSLVQGLDLYASHTRLQEQIRARHLQHGLDLARLELEVDGVSRFKKAPAPAPSALDRTQGEIMRLRLLAESPSAERAQEEFMVPHGEKEFACCMGIDLLSARIFDALQAQLDEVEKQAHTPATPVADAATAAPATADATNGATVPASSSPVAAAAAASPSTAPGPVAPAAAVPAARVRRELSLRAAMGSLMSDACATAVPFFGLHVLGTRFDTATPASYARALTNFAAESDERAQVADDLAMLQQDPHRPDVHVTGPRTSPSSSSTAAAAAASPQATPSPAGQLSNAALRQRAVYD